MSNPRRAIPTSVGRWSICSEPFVPTPSLSRHHDLRKRERRSGSGCLRRAIHSILLRMLRWLSQMSRTPRGQTSCSTGGNSRTPGRGAKMAAGALIPSAIQLIFANERDSGILHTPFKMLARVRYAMGGLFSTSSVLIARASGGNARGRSYRRHVAPRALRD